jgi:hypothetical protein
MGVPGHTAHLSSEDGGIPAVSWACHASATGDDGGGWESQDGYARVSPYVSPQCCQPRAPGT